MLPRTFLTQLIPARIREGLDRVEAAIWRPLEAEIRVEQTPSFRTHCRAEEIGPESFTPVPAAPFAWGPKFAQRWFRVTLPPAGAGPRRYLRWNDQAEATAYVCGVPYYGLDLAHRHCPIPDDVDELLIEAVCVKTGIWLNGAEIPLGDAGSAFAPPQLVQRDDLAWAVYHDLRVLLDVLKAEYEDATGAKPTAFGESMRLLSPVVRATPLFRRWCARLDAAIDTFDRDGLAALRVELERLYAESPASPDSLTAVLAGHAHIDLVWLWPERVGEFKAVHSWATQTRLCEAYPEFRFTASQPASYAAVARRSPALHARVGELIRAGRWEATGGAYVESDTQLPCGEALLRALRLGQADFRRLRGTPSKVCWLPDVFGYSGVLPQLLRGFGIEGFFTTKLSWNPLNRPPHSSFRWRGPDGASVVAHLALLHDYNEAVDVRNLREDALHHLQAAVHPEFLVPTGYGDGGGGPTEEMCERARRVRSLAGVPRTEWGGIEAFFARLNAVASELPEVAGELYFELHRGVFTTHGRLKAAYRGLERALQLQEAAHVARQRGPIDEHAWRRLIFAQFHDYLPGSSIWEVYAEGLPELEQLATAATAGAAELLAPAGHPADGWFNPLPLTRTWIDGEQACDVPPLAGASRAQLRTRPAARPTATATRIEGDRVTAEFTPVGGLARLVIDGHEVALTAEGHRLAAYPDHPTKFPAWDVDRGSLVAGQDARLIGDPVVQGSGLSASVTFFYAVGRHSQVAVRYRVAATEPVLRLEYDVDWQDPELWLKAIVPTRYLGREARFAAPFGSVLRGQWPGHLREEAQWEVPASRWLVVLDDAQAEGLAIITEAKFGFSVRDGVVGVSLLRSALITGADDHPAIRETPDRPRHSDLGRQQIRLALGRYAADLPREQQPAALADLLYTPCVPYAGAPVDSGFRGLIDAPSVLPAWAEPGHEGGWTLRLHETLGRRGSVRVAVAPGWRAGVVGIDGTAPGAGAAEAADGELGVEFGPYQILGVHFQRVSAPSRS